MKNRVKTFNFIFGMILIALVLIPVIMGFFWMPYDPAAMDINARNQAPSLAHIFGTDYFGRDVFCRVLIGARMTFMVGAASIAIGCVLGTLVGAFTGYFGGPVDEVVMRINDALASIPSVLLALVLVGVVGSNRYLVIVTLGIVFTPSFARVARGEFMKGRDMDYVKNAKLMGAGPFRLMFVHILPNTAAIMISSIAIGFNNAVLAEAGLSYLGIGAQPSDVSLGRMLAEAQGYLFTAPWFALAPGLTIVITVLGFALVSDVFGSSSARVRGVSNKRRLSKLIEEQAAKEKREDAANELRGELVRRTVTNEYETPAVTRKEALRKDIVTANTLLEVDKLSVGFYENGAWERIVKGVSFTVRKGEIVGIVGESGSGKSMTALAVMGLLKQNGHITSGSIVFDGNELTKLSAAEYRAIRGAKMSMVFQEPMTSLNPVVKIGRQVEELINIHGLPGSGVYADKRVSKELVCATLGECGLKEPESLYDMYPHQLSGGMRQRVMLAMAMICGPKLLIADEPTTALDVTTQAKILKLIRKMNESYGTAVIFISHDLRIIRKLCDRVVVMKNGEIVEKGTVEEVFEHPLAVYTKKLIAAAPENLSLVKPKVFTEERRLLRVQDLNVWYPSNSGRLFAKKTKKMVVKNANLEIREGEILGLVGESGCGKSTLAKAVSKLLKTKSGKVKLNDTDIRMVFQDPFDSLNPAKKVGWLLKEPLRLSRRFGRKEMEKQVDDILTKVELPVRYKDRYPSELSGGERQRVAIAMALILKSRLIILDEPVSALDVTVQEQILKLLVKLRDEYNLSYLFISHDMQVVRRICDNVAVMYKGEIVEYATPEEIFSSPKQEYTKKLINAAEINI